MVTATPRKPGATPRKATKPPVAGKSVTGKSVTGKSVTGKPSMAATSAEAANPASKPVSNPLPTVSAKSAADTAPIPKVVKVSEPAVVTPDLKKKELIDAVVVRSGIKKKDAKPVVEAMLALLGETLADGRELNLPPMGKLRINRAEDHDNFRVIVCKLRQQTGQNTKPQEPLAEAAE